MQRRIGGNAAISGAAHHSYNRRVGLSHYYPLPCLEFLCGHFVAGCHVSCPQYSIPPISNSYSQSGHVSSIPATPSQSLLNTRFAIT